MRGSGLIHGAQEACGGTGEGWPGSIWELSSPWSAPAASTLDWCTECQTLSQSQGSVCLCHPPPRPAPVVLQHQGHSVTLSLCRGAEILYSLALAHARRAGADGRYPLSDYALLTNARRNLGLFQHHDAIAGTAKEAVAVDYGVRCVWGPGLPQSLSQSGAGGLRARRAARCGDAVGRFPSHMEM